MVVLITSPRNLAVRPAHHLARRVVGVGEHRRAVHRHPSPVPGQVVAVGKAAPRRLRRPGQPLQPIVVSAGDTAGIAMDHQVRVRLSRVGRPRSVPCQYSGSLRGRPGYAIRRWERQSGLAHAPFAVRNIATRPITLRNQAIHPPLSTTAIGIHVSEPHR